MHSSMLQENIIVPPSKSIPKKANGSYFRVMVNLPVIIKEKDLVDRKNTIDVFKKKSTANKS